MSVRYLVNTTCLTIPTSKKRHFCLIVEAHISKASCSLARIVPKLDNSDLRAPAPAGARERFVSQIEHRQWDKVPEAIFDQLKNHRLPGRIRGFSASIQQNFN